jgi:hypothetical protein
MQLVLIPYSSSLDPLCVEAERRSKCATINSVECAVSRISGASHYIGAGPKHSACCRIYVGNQQVFCQRAQGRWPVRTYPFINFSFILNSAEFTAPHGSSVRSLF